MPPRRSLLVQGYLTLSCARPASRPALWPRRVGAASVRRHGESEPLRLNASDPRPPGGDVRDRPGLRRISSMRPPPSTEAPRPSPRARLRAGTKSASRRRIYGGCRLRRRSLYRRRRRRADRQGENSSGRISRADRDRTGAARIFLITPKETFVGQALTDESLRPAERL